MNNFLEISKLQENFYSELFNLLEKMHKSGLPFYEILRIYLKLLPELILKVDAEVWLNKK